MKDNPQKKTFVYFNERRCISHKNENLPKGTLFADTVKLIK